jgi:CheY-like chemotaxis protein
MPGMEGLQTIRALRREHPAVKVVAMSDGSGLAGIVDMLPVALRLGASLALDKPFGRAQARAALAKMLG